MADNPTGGTLQGPENAGDLDKAKWTKVFENNCLLKGLVFREGTRDLTPAPENAFVLKRPGKPSFSVETTRWSETIESDNTFQYSLAQHSFSQYDVSLGLSADVLGNALGIKLGRSHGKSKSAEESESTGKKGSHFTYNFPRVRINLNVDELVLSTACMQAIEQLRAVPNEPRVKKLDEMNRFHERFGHVFASSVVLGGQLYYFTNEASENSADEQKKKDEVQNSMAFYIKSFNQVAQTVASKKTDEDSTEKEMTTSRKLYRYSVCRGGNTLEEDLNKWIQTIARSENWSVIHRTKSVVIYDLIGKMKEHESVPEMFKAVLKPDPSNPSWTGKISLSFRAQGQPPEKAEELCWSGGYLKPKSKCNADPPPERAIFRVRDARDPKPSVSSDLEQFMADRPVYLLRAETNYISAATVYADRARSGICYLKHTEGLKTETASRFSFRPKDMTGPWDRTSEQAHELKNGAEVHLFCHSLGLGPLGDNYCRPRYASDARLSIKTEKPGSSSIYFKIAKHCMDAKALIDQYEDGSLELGYREAFGKMGFISTESYEFEETVEGDLNNSVRRPRLSEDVTSTAEDGRSNEKRHSISLPTITRIQDRFKLELNYTHHTLRKNFETMDWEVKGRTLAKGTGFDWVKNFPTLTIKYEI